MYFVVFCLISISFLLVQCQDSNKVENGSYDYQNGQNIDSSEEQVDRVKAIQKCATCHQEEYKNWLMGPHANTYKSLVEHLDYIDTSENFSDEYKKLVSSTFSTNCIRCHTGQNLYETVFKGLDNEMDERRFSENFYPNMYKNYPLIRKGKYSSFNTGVDCLTCHKSGDKIVTNDSYVAKNKSENKNNCDLIASKFFSTNTNCTTCHSTEVSSMKKLVSEGHLDTEINCNSCHMEYNTQGKPTHYFYWKHDAPGKKRPEKLSMFSDIYAVLRSTNSGQILFFHWGNNYIPHDISACGEVVANVEVRDKNGKLLLEFSKVVNQKTHMIQVNKNVKIFEEGVCGTPLNWTDKPIEVTIPIKSSLKGGKIIIRGMSKPQYWSNKKELKEVFRKEIQIK